MKYIYIHIWIYVRKVIERPILFWIPPPCLSFFLCWEKNKTNFVWHAQQLLMQSNKNLLPWHWKRFFHFNFKTIGFLLRNSFNRHWLCPWKFSLHFCFDIVFTFNLVPTIFNLPLTSPLVFFPQLRNYHWVRPWKFSHDYTFVIKATFVFFPSFLFQLYLYT